MAASPSGETAVSVCGGSALYGLAPASGSDMGGADLSQMLGGFTILRLTNLMGSMTEKKITKDMLLELNEQLNQIAKP